MSFRSDEKLRYARHLCLPEIGISGQQKLKDAKVLCVGAGGLGSVVITYLAASGVGRLGIIDDDRVELSNLHRQVIHDSSTIGQLKALSAKNWVQKHNPAIQVDAYTQRLCNDNVRDILGAYDFIIDGSDNFSTRYMLNDACFFSHQPLIQAGVHQFDGQITTFLRDHGPCYRCLFPHPPMQSMFANCSANGVMGVLPGLMGMIQATEAIKLIVGCGENLIGRLLTVDVLTMHFQTRSFLKNPDCPLCGENPSIISLSQVFNSSKKSIDVKNLKKLLAQQNCCIIDVRESHEQQQLPGIEEAQDIPLSVFEKNSTTLPKEALIILYCQTGHRSQFALEILLQQGYNCLHLKGGIEAWYAR